MPLLQLSENEEAVAQALHVLVLALNPGAMKAPMSTWDKITMQLYKDYFLLNSEKILFKERGGREAPRLWELSLEKNSRKRQKPFPFLKG